MSRRKKGIRGAGTVFQRQDGRWEAKFKVEETGKFKSLYAPTEKEAYGKLQKALQEQKQGILATGPRQKLSDFLPWWLEEVRQFKIRKSTYVRYQITLKKHILPALGHYPLQKLTTQHVQAFYNERLKKTQSPDAVYQAHRVLNPALEYAVKSRLISYNPVSGVSLPSLKKRKVHPLTIEQAHHLLEVAQGHRLEVWLAVAITTGMRLGEITGLHWDDCDLEKGLIEIHRSVAYLVNDYVEGPPKTAKSERTIPISPTVCTLLKKHRIRQNEERLKVGEKWQDKNIVFCNQAGGYVYSNTFRKGFASLLDKAGLPSMHIHDLRHTASTLMQSLGVSPKAVQEMLGHSHLSQTGDYTHVILSMQQQASERMDILFRKPS